MNEGVERPWNGRGTALRRAWKGGRKPFWRGLTHLQKTFPYLNLGIRFISIETLCSIERTYLQLLFVGLFPLGTGFSVMFRKIERLVHKTDIITHFLRVNLDAVSYVKVDYSELRLQNGPIPLLIMGVDF